MVRPLRVLEGDDLTLEPAGVVVDVEAQRASVVQKFDLPEVEAPAFLARPAAPTGVLHRLAIGADVVTDVDRTALHRVREERCLENPLEVLPMLRSALDFPVMVDVEEELAQVEFPLCLEGDPAVVGAEDQGQKLQDIGAAHDLRAGGYPAPDGRGDHEEQFSQEPDRLVEIVGGGRPVRLQRPVLAHRAQDLVQQRVVGRRILADLQVPLVEVPEEGGIGVGELRIEEWMGLVGIARHAGSTLLPCPQRRGPQRRGPQRRGPRRRGLVRDAPTLPVRQATL